MAPWQDVRSFANNRTVYSLTEAAGELGIDVKTLRIRMRLLDIVAEQDKLDRRAKVLTSAQVQQIRDEMSPSHGIAKQDGAGVAEIVAVPPDSLALELIRAHTRQLDQLESRSAELDRRERELETREARTTELLQKVERLLSSARDKAQAAAANASSLRQMGDDEVEIVAMIGGDE